MPTVILSGPIAAAQRERLAGTLTTPWEIATFPEGPDEQGAAAAFARADALVTNVCRTPLPPAPMLRLHQVPASGYDQIDMSLLPPRCAVANAKGHASGIAEYVMAGVLEFAVGIARQDRELRARDWRSSHVTGAPLRPELSGRTMGLVGVGEVGQAVAPLAAAFGMRVLGSAARRREPPPGIEALLPLAELLPLADVIVLSCPLTEETRGLIDAAAFALMRPNAILINIARGPVIDEAALFEALSTRRIGGAVIDVWYRYPTEEDPRPAPGNLPFETLDNILMTPHSSGWTETMLTRRWGDIAANLDALARGRPLANVVRAPEDT